MPSFLIMRGAAVQQRVPLPLAGGRLVLGRDQSSDVVLDDHGMLVSRRHAEVRAGAHGYMVIDLESENGVWRCGTRVAAAALGTVEPIVIGPYRLLLAEVDLDPLAAAVPTYPDRDETLAIPDLSSPGSNAAALIGAGILIGAIGGGLVVWLLLSVWAGPSAARSVEGDVLTAARMVVPTTCARAHAMPWQGPDVGPEEPA
jgi:hypothetical protein